MGFLVDPEPCPFCGGETEVVEDEGRYAVFCLDGAGCGYSGGLRPTEEAAVDAHRAVCGGEAVAEHNRVAKPREPRGPAGPAGEGGGVMETADGIIREMRGHAGHCLFDEEDLASLADRLDAALKAHPDADDYGRLREELHATRERRDECEARMHKAFARVTGAEAESAKLRAALRPVLECKSDFVDADGALCFSAVREAKRIHNRNKDESE